jgi:response regulator RpfG family c-di-GMP phosphodiesterase
MLRVPMYQAKAGMTLAVEIRHPLRGFSLLRAGFELDELLIRKLLALGVHECWIEYPDTELITQCVSPQIIAQRGQTVSMVAHMFDQVHRESFARLEYQRYKRTLRDLIESLVTEPCAATYIVEMGGAASSELRHATEVCMLSILLGLKLQGYLVKQRRRLQPNDARNVVSLGLGAILHDVGKQMLDYDINEYYSMTRDETDPLWQEHVRLGHKMMTGKIPASAAAVILHHHQYYDGSGFPMLRDALGMPKRIEGDAIHIFARIAAVANTFDRMHHQPGGTVVPRVRVLSQMMRPRWPTGSIRWCWRRCRWWCRRTRRARW